MIHHINPYITTQIAIKFNWCYHRAYFQTHPSVTGTSKSPASDSSRTSFRPWACQHLPSAWRPPAEQKRGSGQFGFTIFTDISYFNCAWSWIVVAPSYHWYFMVRWYLSKSDPEVLGSLEQAMKQSRDKMHEDIPGVLCLRTTYCKYTAHGNVNKNLLSFHSS